MLTRFVRIQLAIFAIASVVGMGTVAYRYVQAPTLLGVGRLNVTLELPQSGGLYRFGNVTYRGVQVGKVVNLEVRDGTRVEATLSLDNSTPIPADLTAQVRSMSAVGEQYVDLLPRSESAPYLQEGAVIPMDRASVPQPVGPMLDQVSALVGSLPKDRLGDLLDESYKAFNGAGYDIGSLLDSSSTLASDLGAVDTRVHALIEDSRPLLDGQVQAAESLRSLAKSLAGVTDQVVDNDPQLRTILDVGPGAAQEVTRLLDQVKPTLPVLLANMVTVGQVAVTYHASLEQLLVLLPPAISTSQASGAMNNPTGLPLGDFELAISDPPACDVGFLPPSEWRSPNDLTDVDTPDGLYCKLPQDSPVGVRGARNYPCMGQPGKRAPTVQMCESNEPFLPLAMRPHALGPTPFDPNLIAQGIPPDSRVNPDEGIFGPLAGTPLPPGAVPSGTPPDATAPVDPRAENPVAAPSGFEAGDDSPAPVAVASYNRQTGVYMGPDGQLHRQIDLVASGLDSRTWQDLVFAEA